MWNRNNEDLDNSIPEVMNCTIQISELIYLNRSSRNWNIKWYHIIWIRKGLGIWWGIQKIFWRELFGTIFIKANFYLVNHSAWFVCLFQQLEQNAVLSIKLYFLLKQSDPLGWKFVQTSLNCLFPWYNCFVPLLIPL